MSFRFHYLSGVIPLALIPCEVFWGWGKGEPSEARGRGGPARVAGASRGGQHGRGGGWAGWGAQAGKDWTRGARARKDQVKGSSTGALCTKFTLLLYRCSTENLVPIVYGTRILVTCSITSNLVPCSIDWNFDPMYNWELGSKIQSREHCSWFVISGPIYVMVHEIKTFIQFWILLPCKIGTKI